MLTKKNNPMSDLLNIVISSAHVSLIKPKDFNLEVNEHMVEKLVEDIPYYIQQEKRGSKQMEKCIERIEYHKEQLLAAFQTLVEAYVTATTPQTRTSSKLKTQQDMLATFNDKFLKLYAEGLGVDISDFILPDDRGQLEDKIIEMLNKGSQQ